MLPERVCPGSFYGTVCHERVLTANDMFCQQSGNVDAVHEAVEQLLNVYWEGGNAEGE